jgi:hypothetical protein
MWSSIASVVCTACLAVMHPSHNEIHLMQINYTNLMSRLMFAIPFNLALALDILLQRSNDHYSIIIRNICNPTDCITDNGVGN